MVEVVLGVGSNNDREQHICNGLSYLQQQFGELQLSPVYESFSSQKEQKHLYYNLVLSLQTNLDYQTLKQQLREIEEKNGRQRHTLEVTLDLDILLYGDESNPVTPLPHPDILNCAYVLRPLSDLFPEKQHPTMMKNYKELWHTFSGDISLEPVDFVWNGKLVSSSVVLAY